MKICAHESRWLHQSAHPVLTVSNVKLLMIVSGTDCGDCFESLIAMVEFEQAAQTSAAMQISLIFMASSKLTTLREPESYHPRLLKERVRSRCIRLFRQILPR